jgi:hypothetical protein
VQAVAKLAHQRGEFGVEVWLGELDAELRAAHARGAPDIAHLSNERLQSAMAALK